MENRKSLLLQMLNLQEKINVTTCGADWRQGTAKNGRKIDWRLAILMEGAEFIDSFDWKHWGLGDDDFQNAQLELVDIWHFIMSLALVYESDAEKIAGDFLSSEVKNAKFGKDEAIASAKRLIFVASNLHEPREDFDRRAYMREFYLIFWDLMRSINLPFNKLFCYYIGKNALNEFRQRKGYLTGEYQKMWGNRQDNVFLNDYLNDNPNATYDEVLHYLETTYKKVFNR